MNKIFELKFGSALYGTSTENSDLDLKSVYIPEAKEIVLGKYPKSINMSRPKGHMERNIKDDVDIEIFSLDRYLQLLAQGQTVALDILFAPMNMYTYTNEDEYWLFSQIYNNRDRLITKDITAFFGYAKQQAAKYGLKGFRVAAYRDTLEFLSDFKDYDKLADDLIYPKLCKFVYKRPQIDPEPKSNLINIETKTSKNGIEEIYLQVCGKFYPLKANVKLIRNQMQERFDEYGKRALLAEQNEGIDFKACSHAVRVNSQGVELLQTGNITFPRPDKEMLLKIKTGSLPFKEIEQIILEGFEQLEKAKELSTLREKPDQEWIDNFVAEVYSNVVMDEWDKKHRKTCIKDV